MKLFIKGGSCIEVDSKVYCCVITPEKVGFSKVVSHRDSSTIKHDCGFEDFIIPRQFVERIEV